MIFKRGRYSKLLAPFLFGLDLFIIFFLGYFFFDFDEFYKGYKFVFSREKIFYGYLFVVWCVISIFNGFYSIYRYSKLSDLVFKILKQFLSFSLFVFSFIGAFRFLDFKAILTIQYLFFCLILISSFKIISYYLLRKLRILFGGNLRKVVIIGNDIPSGILRIIKNKQLGYNIKKEYKLNAGNHSNNEFEETLLFLSNHKEIDEVFCLIDELSDSQLKELVKLSFKNKFNLKFIPKNKTIFSRKYKVTYFSDYPLLSFKANKIDGSVSYIVKRCFDILFSISILVFIMSWLHPIIWVLIKINSKGPVIFKHTRDGLNYESFECYKYRSLYMDRLDQDYVKKNDSRVTKVGKFLRKTSLDELPQFFNVLKGDMSVVGPRPHMIKYTSKYSKKIDKYDFTFRHNVKPGITGLAQISGFRGEIKSDIDIVNRIKYDIFYIENWSLFFDLKIIFKTVLNAIKGEEKAY